MATDEDIATQMSKLLHKLNEIRAELSKLNKHIRSFRNSRSDPDGRSYNVDPNAPSYNQFETKEPNSHLREELLKQKTAGIIDLSHKALITALDAVEKAFIDIRATRNSFDRILKDADERDNYREWLRNQS